MLRVGDIVEILEPEDTDNYPLGWNTDMNNYVGNQNKISRVFIGYNDEVCYLLANPWSWHESNLKLISRNTKTTIDMGDTVIITKGKHVGKISKVVEQYENFGEIYHDLQNSIMNIPDANLKPINHMIELF